MSKRRVAAFAVTVLALVVAGCGGSSSSRSKSSGKIKEGGTFRLGTSSRIDSLNPYVAFNQEAYNTFFHIYPLLVQYDLTYRKFVPELAKSWKPSKDGKTWTFKLVSGAKWSDGKPLTASDAAWTVNIDIKYRSSGAANSAGLIAHIVRAEAPNPTTLVVRYDGPVGNVLSQFEQFPILPRHIWSQHTGHKGADLKTFPNHAPIVGAGPFTLVKFKKDEIALFKRNDSFYGPKPHIDSFGLRMFTNDDALVSALKAHEIDSIGAVPATAIKTLENAGMNVKTVPGVDQTDFIINSSPQKRKHRELLSPKLREAFAHAIDRDHIIRVVFLGRAKPAYSIIPSTTGDWSNPNLKPETFDLALANRILDELGYKRGPGGIRVAEGHKMAYDVITPTDLSSADRTFQIIQPDFRKIGVQLRQRALDSSTAFDEISAPNYKYLNFDLSLWDWVALPDPDFMLSVVTCDQLGGWSDSGFCDKRYDQLYSQQQLTPDQTKRRAIVWKMQKYLYDRRPYIWLATEDQVSATDKKWAGLDYSPQGPFNQLSRLSLTRLHQVG